MRTRALLTIVTVVTGLLSSACTKGAAREPAPAGGALVKASSTSIAPETETRIELTPGQNARLIVALGDRISQLDLTPSEAHAKLGDALVGFAPVQANETVTLRVRARPWTGAHVLETFVMPFGGELASDALKAAAPEFAKGKMIAVQIDIMTATSVQTTIHNLVIAAGEHPGASTRFEVGGVLGFGSPLRVQDWVMAGGDGYTPALSQRESTLRASAPAGEVAMEQLPAAAWTLWLQLEPEGA